MNLIINSSCNKNCSFCFAHKFVSDEKQQLSKEEFLKYLNFLERTEERGFDFTGGEPSDNPNIKFFIKEAASRDFKVSLVSNLLFQDEELIQLIDKHCLDIIANGSELNGSQLEVFKNNFNKINHKTTLSLTIDESYTSADFIPYVDSLFENLNEIRSIRTSLSLNQKGNFYFINNKDFGKIFIYLYNKFVNYSNNDRWLTVECSTFPCIYENFEDFLKIKEISYSSKGLDCECGVENNMMKYYSNFMSDNVLRIPFEEDLPTRDAQTKFQEELKKIKSKLLVPPICLQCNHYNDECKGPCFAFYSEENLNA